MKKILMTICALTFGGALAVAQAGGAAGQSSPTPQAGTTEHSTTQSTTQTTTKKHKKHKKAKKSKGGESTSTPSSSPAPAPSPSPSK
jgi:hypothetical protein